MAPKTKKVRASAADESSEVSPESVLDDVVDELNAGSQGRSAYRLSDDGLSIHLPGVISTGSEWLDLAIGRGGIPLSRTVLLSGNEGCGKTTLALTLCANIQRAGGLALYIDAEYKLDRDYAAALGVDVERLILAQPGSMESCLEAITSAVAAVRRTGSKRPLLIVVDSLNSMPTNAELEGKDNPGTSARVMSAGLRKAVAALSHERVSLVLISQIRQKIGVLFGSPNTTGCGNAPRFYSAVILEMTAIAGVKEDGVKVGNKVKVEVVKNQIAPPFRKSELILRFGAGFDWVYGLNEAARVAGVVEDGKSGWMIWSTAPGGPLKWQGAAGLRRLLEAEGGAQKALDLLTALRSQYGWNDVPSIEEIPRLLAAGAPFEPPPGSPLADDDDED